MPSTTGIIYDIQHFCTHDGPGIRTTVFLKGCPLHCLWCHNPESQSFRSEILYHQTQCIACNACEDACPYHEAHVILADAGLRKERCHDCQICADACLYGAIEIAGREYTVQEVMDELMKDISYYQHSGGGITLSGGEALAQSKFAYALLRAAKRQGIHTAIETSGFCRPKDLSTLVPFTDLWLWDIKMLDASLHKELTGIDVVLLHNNLKYLSALNATIMLRILYIPELHSADSYVEQLVDFMKSLPVLPLYEVIPYHKLGLSKRKKLGLSHKKGYYREPTQEEINTFEERMKEKLANV